MLARRNVGLLVVILAVSWCSAASACQIDSAAKYLPGSTAIYVEIEQPASVIDKVLDHSAAKFAFEQKEYKDLLASPQMAAAMIGMKVLEAQTGQTLVESLKTNLGNGACLAFDTKTQGAVLLFQSRDEAKLKRLAGTLLSFAESDAKNKNKKSPFEKTEYRGAKVAKFDDFLVARYENWLLVSNKPKLAKAVVDNMHDGSETPLANQTWFVESRKHTSSEADAWAAVDLKTLRMAGVAKELFQGNTDNPGLELVIGGVLDALKNSPVAVAELNVDDRIGLSLKSPFDTEWATAARSFFYGKDMDGQAPMAFQPKNMIASLTSYRDLGDWWLSKEDLFAENVVAQLAQADSQFSTIFSGLDFGEEVLGSFEPGVQIVVADNQYQEEYQPDVRLPAFAMVSRLKDGNNIQRRFKIAFQSVIGFANIQLGMEGQPQLDLETEKIGSSRISTANYMFDDMTDEGLLLFNFAPTIAFQDSYFIVSSNRDLAVELAELAEKRVQAGEEAKSDPTNTRISVKGDALRKILDENREALIANNMLEEGNTRAQAEQQIGFLLKMATAIKSVDLDLVVEDDQMKLDLGVQVEN